MSAIYNLVFSQLRDPFPRRETSETPLDNFPPALNELIGEYLDPISLDNLRNMANTLNHDLMVLSIRTHKRANRIFAKSFVKAAAITISPLILRSVHIAGDIFNELEKKVRTEVGIGAGMAVLIGSSIMMLKMYTLITKVTAAAFRKLSPLDVLESIIPVFVGWMSMSLVNTIFEDSIPAPIAITGGTILAGLVAGEFALRDAGLYHSHDDP